MAGSVEHLAVAVELIRLWGKGKEHPEGEPVICRPERFLLGNLCPDGIMSREGYERSMKMHTHFRDGILDCEFALAKNQKLFHQRIHAFAGGTLTDSSLEHDLYLGYLTHILTDEFFMLTVRPEFMGKISVLGLTQQDEETFVHFTHDVNQIDFRLAREYPGMEWVRTCLGEAEPYEIRGMLSEKELTDSRQWVLRFFFEEAPEPQEPLYYTYGRALRFIREAVDFVRHTIREYTGGGNSSGSIREVTGD